MLTASDKPIKRRLRWKSLCFLTFAAFCYWLYIWVFWDTQRQDKILRTGLLILIFATVSFLWLMLMSGLPWKRRFQIAGVCLFGIVSFGGIFRISEVTGDLVPILEPRWRHVAVSSTPAAAAPIVPSTPVTNTFWFPQYLGPNRDGVLPDTVVKSDWTTHPPQQVWRHPVGAAWSGFAVAGVRAVTMEQRGDDEAITCYDLMTGLPLWEHRYAARYATTIGGEGPRVTPTLSRDRVYTMGGSGVTSCVNLADGKPVWSRNLYAENQLTVGDWGVVSAPLLVGNRVIVSIGAGAGKSLFALDSVTGSTIWSGGDDGASYSSPTLLNIAGQPQILIFNNPGVAAHDPVDGKVLWSYPWKSRYPKITLPLLVHTNQVLLTSGYGAGSELIEITQTNAQFLPKLIWKSIRLKSKFGNIITWQGFIYGLDDGILTCINPENGQSQWKDGRYGHAQMLLVNDLLLLTTETGELALVEPNPVALKELARMKVLDDKTWNPPAVAGPYVILRNHREAICYKLPLRT